MGTVGGECGIGLKVERTAVGYVVTGLKHKFPAHLQGVLKVGFLVVSVDGVDVTNSLCALPPLVLGQEGTPVTIGFVRAPGEATEYLDVTRGGAAAGNSRSFSSMSMHGENSSRAAGRAMNVNDSHSNAHGLLGDGSQEGSPSSTVDHMPAMRLDTGASSAMELRMYGNHSSSEVVGMDHEKQVPNSPPRRRSRSVALLPSAGSKHRPYIRHTPTWRIDARPVEHRPMSSISNMSRTASEHSWPTGSAVSMPASPGRSAVATAAVTNLSPNAVAVTGTSPRHDKSPLNGAAHAKDAGQLSGAGEKEGASANELSDQQRQALVVFARTPEGKMWKAERLREKHALYHKQRSAWAHNSVINDLPPTSGKFSTANTKSEYDWIIYYAQQLPGVGAYNPKLPQREGRKDPATSTSKFGTACRFGPSTIDHSIPGAGAYNPVRQTFSKVGGKFNGSSKVRTV